MNKSIKKQIVIFGSNLSTDIRRAFTVSSLFNAVVPVSAGQFVSGESFTELFPKSAADFDRHTALLKDSHVVIVQSTSAPVNDSVMELLMLAHTAKHYGAEHVTAVIPFAAFARQDRAFPERFGSVAADLLPRIVHASGIDRVMTVTPHSKASIDFWHDEYQGKFSALSTTALFANDIRATLGANPAAISIGAPDGANKPADEGQSRARDLCAAVFNEAAADPRKMFRISKTHTGVNSTAVTGFDGDVIGKDCIIVDDMVDGGSTIVNAAAQLKQKGARSVTAYLTHAVLSPTKDVAALERILIGTQVDKIVLTDTMTDVAEKVAVLKTKMPPAEIAARVRILSVGDMLVHAVKSQTAPKP